MKTTTINTLHIRGYRGRNLSVAFGDKDTIISGDNGEGKSTTYNALLWLLIGVDSDDNTNKNIFDNRTDDDPDNPKTAAVEGHFTIDGTPTALHKIAEQTWKYDKSADEPTLVRVADTYRYFINGYEITATEYKQFVADTFGRADGYLKLMLNPRYWEMLDTRSLRKYFAEIVGKIDDTEFDGYYDEIVLFEIKRCGVEKALTNERDTRKRVDMLVDRNKVALADIKAEVPSLADIETAETKADSLEKEKQYLEMRRAALTEQNSELVAKRKAEEDAIAEKRSELQRAESDYKWKQDAEERKLVSEWEAAKDNNATAKRRKEEAEKDLEDARLRYETAALIREQLYRDVDAIKKRVFDGHCDNCGAAYVGAKRQERIEAFKAKKAKDLADKIAEGQTHVAKMQVLADELDKAEARLANIERVDVRKYEDALIAFRKNKKAWEVTDECKTLTAKLQALEQSRTEIPTNSELTKVQVRIGEIDAELKALYMEIGNKRGDYNKGNTEVERLKTLLKTYSQEKATALKREAQVLAYQREYAEIVRQRVNANFKNVSVEMTAPNKSGGLEDVCKLRLDGVADTCNYANRIKIGIEVAQVFQKHFGVILPLWIDNAESITDIPEHEGQRVMLRVEKGQVLTIKTE